MSGRACVTAAKWPPPSVTMTNYCGSILFRSLLTADWLMDCRYVATKKSLFMTRRKDSKKSRMCEEFKLQNIDKIVGFLGWWWWKWRCSVTKRPTLIIIVNVSADWGYHYLVPNVPNLYALCIFLLSFQFALRSCWLGSVHSQLF